MSPLDLFQLLMMQTRGRISSADIEGLECAIDVGDYTVYSQKTIVQKDTLAPEDLRSSLLEITSSFREFKIVDDPDRLFFIYVDELDITTIDFRKHGLEIDNDPETEEATIIMKSTSNLLLKRFIERLESLDPFVTIKK